MTKSSPILFLLLITFCIFAINCGGSNIKSDKQSIELNNQGVDAYQAGNKEQAISFFEQFVPTHQ